MFCDMVSSCGEELLPPHPTPKTRDQPLSAVRNCLFKIFAPTLNIGARLAVHILRTRHAVVTRTHLSRLHKHILQ